MASSGSLQRGWDLISLDIGCAFLKGWKFEGVAEMNKTQQTVVDFDLRREGRLYFEN